MNATFFFQFPREYFFRYRKFDQSIGRDKSLPHDSGYF